MPKKHKEYILIGVIALIAFIVMILAIVALNQSNMELWGPYSIKDIYNNLLPSAPGAVRHTAGMAYIGSIITLVASIGTILYAGALVYISIGLKKEILTTKILYISLAILIVIFALGLASIITASNLTNTSWITKQLA